MIVQLSKWGNSLGIRIPKQIAGQAHLTEGTKVELQVENGQVVLKPVPKPAYTLEWLLEGITPENCHGEVSTGKAVGREVW